MPQNQDNIDSQKDDYKYTKHEAQIREYKLLLEVLIRNNSFSKDKNDEIEISNNEIKELKEKNKFLSQRSEKQKHLIIDLTESLNKLIKERNNLYNKYKEIKNLLFILKDIILRLGDKITIKELIDISINELIEIRDRNYTQSGSNDIEISKHISNLIFLKELLKKKHKNQGDMMGGTNDTTTPNTRENPGSTSTTNSGQPTPVPVKQTPAVLSPAPSMQPQPLVSGSTSGSPIIRQTQQPAPINSSTSTTNSGQPTPVPAGQTPVVSGSPIIGQTQQPGSVNSSTSTTNPGQPTPVPVKQTPPVSGSTSGSPIVRKTQQPAPINSSTSTTNSGQPTPIPAGQTPAVLSPAPSMQPQPLVSGSTSGSPIIGQTQQPAPVNSSTSITNSGQPTPVPAEQTQQPANNGITITSIIDDENDAIKKLRAIFEKARRAQIETSGRNSANSDKSKMESELKKIVGNLRIDIKDLITKKHLDDAVYDDKSKSYNLRGKKLVTQSFDNQNNQFEFNTVEFTGVITVQRRDKDGKILEGDDQCDLIHYENGKIVEIIMTAPTPSKDNCRIYNIAEKFYGKEIFSKDINKVYSTEQNTEQNKFTKKLELEESNSSGRSKT